VEIFIIMITGFVLFVVEGELYRRLWHKGLDAEVQISPAKAFRGDKCSLTLTLTNRKLLPLPWLWAKLHISASLHFEDKPKATGDYVYHNALFCIMGWQQIRRTLPFTCTKRGYYPIRSFDVTGTSILFNGKHTLSFSAPAALTVYAPLISTNELASVLSQTDGYVAKRGYINPDPFEFAGIREYTASDSFKSINFKASAHANTLMTNTYNPTVKGKVTILLCFKLLKQAFEEERFEYAVSLAATLAQHYISMGYSVALYCNGRDAASGDSIRIPHGIGEGRLSNIYESLARVSYSSSHYDEVATLSPDCPSSSSAIFISPTVDKAILELYGRVKSSYASAQWLFPVMGFDAPRTTPPDDTAMLVPVPSDFLTYDMSQ
jgi:uncharacterized protein (DUF58 family)